MKCHMIYSCEFCHKRFDSVDECEEHEAEHYGLTLEQYREWSRIHHLCVNAGAMVGISKNPDTEAAFDRAIHELVTFEKAHGLSGVNAPMNWR